MNKKVLALTALSLICTEALTARELKCEQCESQPIECVEQLFVERSQFFIIPEFLYWRASAAPSEYAIERKGSTTATNTFAIGDYSRAHYKWEPGFRIAAMYYRCPRYWEMTAEYTWFYDRGKNQASELVNPARHTQSSGPFATASSLIGLHYHLGDLYVDRVFDPNPHLRIRLIGGLTYAWIKQSWGINYTDVLGDFDRVDEKWRFKGGGLRGGIRTDWYWGCRIFLTGKSTAALLYGSYSNREIQSYNEEQILLSDARYHDHRMAMHMQVMLGPSWQVPCDCWSFELFAGWELNLWMNIQERIRTEFNGQVASKEVYHSTGVFGMQGLTLRLTLGF